MKKLLSILLVVSFGLADSSLDSKINTIESKLDKQDNINKQNESFYNFQKDHNLETKKMLNECQDSLSKVDKVIAKANSNIVSSEDIGKLKSMIYKLEQDLYNLKKKVK